MRTHRANYIFHKFFPFAFSVLTLLFSLVGIIFPEAITTTVNREEVETSFLILLPGIVIGLIMLKIGFWLNKNYFRLYMDTEVIDVFKHGRKERIHWEDIENINSVEWLWKGTIFKLKPKGKNAFYFLADKPKMNSRNFFRKEFETEMANLIEQKKRQLRI